MSRDHKDLENQNSITNKSFNALQFIALLIIGGLLTGVSISFLTTAINSFAPRRPNENNSGDDNPLNPFPTFDNDAEAFANELSRAARSATACVDYSNVTASTILATATTTQMACQNSVLNPLNGQVFMVYCDTPTSVKGIMLNADGSVYKPSFNLTANPTDAEYFPNVEYVNDVGNYRVSGGRYNATQAGVGLWYRYFDVNGTALGTETPLFKFAGANVCAWTVDSNSPYTNNSVITQLWGIAQLCNTGSYAQLFVYPRVCEISVAVCSTAAYQITTPGGYYGEPSLKLTSANNSTLIYGTHSAYPTAGNAQQVYQETFSMGSPTGSLQVFGSSVHYNPMTLTLPNGNNFSAAQAKQGDGTWRIVFSTNNGLSVQTSETMLFNSGYSQTLSSLALEYDMNNTPWVVVTIVENNQVKVAFVNANTMAVRSTPYAVPTSSNFGAGWSQSSGAVVPTSTKDKFFVRSTETNGSNNKEVLNIINMNDALVVAPTNSTFTQAGGAVNLPIVLQRAIYAPDVSYRVSLIVTPNTLGYSAGTLFKVNSPANTTVITTSNGLNFTSVGVIALNSACFQYLPPTSFTQGSGSNLTRAITDVTVSYTITSNGNANGGLVNILTGNIGLTAQEGAHAPTLWTNTAGLSVKQNIAKTLTLNDINALGDAFSDDTTTIFNISNTTPSSVTLLLNGAAVTQFSRADLVAGNVAVLVTQCTTTFPTINFTVTADGYTVSGSLPVTTLYGAPNVAAASLLISSSASGVMSANLPYQLVVNYCGNSSATFTGSVKSSGITYYTLPYSNAPVNLYVTQSDPVTGILSFTAAQLSGSQLALMPSGLQANATYYAYAPMSYTYTLTTPEGVTSVTSGSVVDGRTATPPTPTLSTNKVTLTQAETVVGSTILAATFSSGGLDPNFISFDISNLNDCYFTLDGVQVTTVTQTQVNTFSRVKLEVTGPNPSYWVSARYINSATAPAAASVTNNIPVPTTVAPSTATPTTATPTTATPTTAVASSAPPTAAPTTLPPAPILNFNNLIAYIWDGVSYVLGLGPDNIAGSYPGNGDPDNLRAIISSQSGISFSKTNFTLGELFDGVNATVTASSIFYRVKICDPDFPTVCSTNSPASISYIARPTNAPTAIASSAPPTVAATSAAPTAEATSAVPTVEATSAVPTAQSTSAVPTAEATSAVPTAEATSAVPTAEATSAVPTAQSTSAVPTAEATSAVPTAQSTSAVPTVEATGSPTGAPTNTAAPTVILTAAPRTAPDISFNAFNVTALNQLLPYGVANIQAAAIYHSFDELVFYFSRIVGGVFYTGPVPITMLNNVTAAITGLQILQGLIQIKVLQDAFTYAITACTPYELCSSPEDAAVSFYLPTAAPTTPSPSGATPQQSIGDWIVANYAIWIGPVAALLFFVAGVVFWRIRRTAKAKDTLLLFQQVSSLSLGNATQTNRLSMYLDQNRVAKELIAAIERIGGLKINIQDDREITRILEWLDTVRLVFSGPTISKDKRFKSFDAEIISTLVEQHPDEDAFDRLRVVFDVLISHIMYGPSLSRGELVSLTFELLENRRRLSAAVQFVTEKYIFNNAPTQEGRDSYEMNEMGAGVNGDSPSSSVRKAAASSSSGSDVAPVNSSTNLLGSQPPSRAGSNSSNRPPSVRIEPPPPEYTAHEIETPTLSQPELLAPTNAATPVKERRPAPKPPSEATVGFAGGREEAAALAAMMQEMPVSPEPTVLAAPPKTVALPFEPRDEVSREEFNKLFDESDIAAHQRAQALSSTAPKPAVSKIRVGTSPAYGNVRPADGTVVKQATQASNDTIFNTVPSGLVRQPTTGSAPPPTAPKPRVAVAGRPAAS